MGVTRLNLRASQFGTQDLDGRAKEERRETATPGCRAENVTENLGAVRPHLVLGDPRKPA